MKASFRYIYAIGIVSCLLACGKKMVFDQYVHTPVAGWEKTDDVVFHVAGMKEAGTYQEDLGLRITSAYPFMRLTLVVTSKYFEHGQRKPYEERRDTLLCNLIDANGSTNGQGVSYYQYSLPITARQLHEGDSLEVSIRHDMKREILPGVTDIGLQVSRIK